MLGLPTRSNPPEASTAPAPTPEGRQRLLATIADEETRGAARLARLAAQVADARDREVRARELLDAAARDRAAYEAEHLADSASLERRLHRLRQDLVAGAPAELGELVRNITRLVEYARTKARTQLVDGFQDLSGRRPMLAATNTDAIAALIEAAGRVVAALRAEQHSEAPRLDRFGPFAEVAVPRARFQPARRDSDDGELVPLVLVVPLVLAEAWAAISGVGSPKPMLSPGEARFLEADVEAANRKRWNSGEAWR